jgi:hypothetical protein
MVRNYEVFERFPDGSTLWRASVAGIRSAHNTLKELSTETKNECYALNLQTGEIIARFNGDRALRQIPATPLP